MAKSAGKLAGRFIVLDGPDGSGKTTQLELLADHLRGCGVSVVQTRDPGGTRIGDQIRRILLDRAHTEMEIGCEILLYMASRTQLMGEVIAPAMAAGQCVLCDRWVSATIAYQVAEGRATAGQVRRLYRLALKGARPDLTVILDMEPKIGLARAAAASGHDRMESKGLPFHRKVRRLFLRQAGQAEKAPELFAVVDGSGSVEQVQQRLRDIVENWRFPDGAGDGKP